MTTFPEYLRGLRKLFDSQRALADAVGITPQRLSRAISGDGDFPLNIENCLRLAKAANRPPREVLEAAGKGEVADLLEFLYPRSGRPSITGAQKELLDDWEQLDDEERKAYRTLIRRQVAQKHRRRTA